MAPRSRWDLTAPPGFLWVNKTPSSETLSTTRKARDKDDLRVITSHARQWCAATRHQQRRSTVQSGAIQSIVGWERAAVDQEDSAHSSRSSSKVPIPWPSPPIGITGNSTDPFAYLEEPGDAWWSRNAFRYAVDMWLPTVFRSVAAFDPGIPVGQELVMNQIIRGCLSNEMHMYTLLAASTGRLKFVLKVPLARTDSPEYCITKAIQHLRRYFATYPPPSEAVIFDLGALSTFERYVENYAGARAHLRMIKHLVESLGGFQNISPLLRSLCWMRDLLIAGNIADCPIFPLVWDPGEFPPAGMAEVLNDLASQRVVATSSGLLQYATSFQADFCAIIIDFVQWVRVVQHSHCTAIARAMNHAWVTLRAHALAHRLLSSSSNAPTSVFSSPIFQSTLQQYIHLALAVYLSNLAASLALDSNGNRAAFAGDILPRNIHRFREALGKLSLTHESQWERHQELLFWFSCLGAQLATSEYDRNWFIHIGRRYARVLAISTSEQLAAILGKYLCRFDSSGRPSIVGLECMLP